MARGPSAFRAHVGHRRCRVPGETPEALVLRHPAVEGFGHCAPTTMTARQRTGPHPLAEPFSDI